LYTSETGFISNRDLDVLLTPDTALIASGRVPQNAQGFIDIVPDLVVEVVSSNDGASYGQQKVFEFLKAGMRLVWVVCPRHVYGRA
jgi:Uma2 family endonuclease